MDAEELRDLQRPLKKRYRDDPPTALVTNLAEGEYSAEGLTCTVAGWAGPTVAGLHPATGGDGAEACSADMLLEALVACAGVTLRTVATAMGIELRGACVAAEGRWDARGTLGVDRDTPVGITDIDLRFELDTDAPAESVEKLIELTERYCVIYQTLRRGPALTSGYAVAAEES